MLLMTSVSDADAPTVRVTVSVADAPTARFPIVQIPDVVLYVVLPLPTAETKLTPAGRLAARMSVSLIVTPDAFDTPLLRAVIV
jgi:hypothetical protein